MSVLLQQAQPLPIKAGFTQRITVAVMFGFSDAPAERVIGHVHDRFATILLATDFDQAMLSVIGEILYATRCTALFDHATETVVAVTFVLIGQQLVMHHQARIGLWAVQQVGGGVVQAIELATVRQLGMDQAAKFVRGKAQGTDLLEIVILMSMPLKR